MKFEMEQCALIYTPSHHKQNVKTGVCDRTLCLTCCYDLIAGWLGIAEEMHAHALWADQGADMYPPYYSDERAHATSGGLDRYKGEG